MLGSLDYYARAGSEGRILRAPCKTWHTVNDGHRKILTNPARQDLNCREVSTRISNAHKSTKICLRPRSLELKNEEAFPQTLSPADLRTRTDRRTANVSD